MHEDVFVSWSGGKDSCFACYRALASGLKVHFLLNMMTEDGERSWIHDLSTELLKMQSLAVGIPLIQKRTTMATYEADFKEVIQALKEDGITGGVFGDIELAEHRDWVVRICSEAGINPILPLWGASQEKLLNDFITEGFEAIIVVAKADILGEEWLGHKVDQELVAHLLEIKKERDIHLCGEAGEYHTFVVDGPGFNRRLEILETRKSQRDGYWFLDILNSDIKIKG